MLQNPVPEKSCWTCLRTFEVDITSAKVMDVLSIPDMAESKLPPDIIAFLTSKLAATTELLPSMS